MTFLSSDHLTKALVITQVISSEENLPIALPWVNSVLDKTQITINGNEGELITARRYDGVLVNGVYWKADGIFYVILTTQPEKEAITLAQSMHP